ncbi:hypothetical protein ACIQGZ_16035 [Streptomyces sp. NPDC092296]|uniref:hypothetical protein n=1 Tax=Streptomyces sp. NPDC092296 TaxID=3366012 RepID=UPI0037FD58EA
MNLRSLTRGDAAVAVGALLLLIASFLPLYSIDGECKNDTVDICSYNTWHSGFLLHLATVVLAGLGAAALILLARFQGEAAQSRQIAGLKLGQWGVALAAFAVWSGLWSLFTNGAGYTAAFPGSDSGADHINHGFGAYLAFIGVLVIGVGAVATPVVPALQAKLLSDRPAPAPQQGGYPGGPQGGYPGGPQGGYPGGPQQGGYPGGPQSGYGYPAPQHGGAQQWGAPQPQGPGAHQPQDTPFGGPAPTPTPTPAPATAAAAPSFAPFWFAVPAPRPLAPEDNPAGPPVGELTPGTWYLAVEQRGAALVAQLQDGRRGLLADTSGIQRG